MIEATQADPQSKARRALRYARATLALLALLATLYLAGTYVAPLLRAQGTAAGSWLHWAYAPTCHQMAERSIAIAGQPQAVCSRCSGLYIGGVAALWTGLAALLVAGRLRRISPWWLAAACAPTFLDAVLGIVGLPQLPLAPRLWISIPAGFVAGLFLALGAVEIAATSRAPRTPAPPPPPAPRTRKPLASSTTEFQPGG